MCATRRSLTREEREALGSLGERAAEAGIGLRTLVRAHLSAAQRLRPGLPRSAVERAVDAFAEGHERAQHLAMRQEEAARREFVDDNTVALAP